MKGVFFHKVIDNLGQYSPSWSVNMSEYLLWLLSHGVTLCACHSAASSHQFLSFHCPSLVTTQQIWYLERKKPKTTTQNTHTLLCLFLCLSARSVKLCCCVYNVTDISVTQNRFCRTLLLCSTFVFGASLQEEAAAQAGWGEKSWAGASSQSQALCPSHRVGRSRNRLQCHI